VKYLAYTMYSACCQSKLLTADCFSIELSRDPEFKTSFAGRLRKRPWNTEIM